MGESRLPEEGQLGYRPVGVVIGECTISLACLIDTHPVWMIVRLIELTNPAGGEFVGVVRGHGGCEVVGW